MSITIVIVPIYDQNCSVIFTYNQNYSIVYSIVLYIGEKSRKKFLLSLEAIIGVNKITTAEKRNENVFSRELYVNILHFHCVANGTICSLIRLGNVICNPLLQPASFMVPVICKAVAIADVIAARNARSIRFGN